MLRKVLFWAGCLLLIVYTVVFAVQAWILQDIPPISYLKWGILAATFVMIYAARDRDEAFAHHLPH